MACGRDGARPHLSTEARALWPTHERAPEAFARLGAAAVPHPSCVAPRNDLREAAGWP